MDDENIRALSTLAGKPVPDVRLTPKQKQKALDDAMEWLRLSDVSPE
jgi:hypothetical protein